MGRRRKWFFFLNTGSRYNPVTENWAAITISGAPLRRYTHTAVWSGTEMIVWGGSHNNAATNTGGHYNPITNSWTATPTIGASGAKQSHTAISTGTEMRDDCLGRPCKCW